MSVAKVKICCISNIEEAQLAIKYGASSIGLVGHMPSGPGIIKDEKIKEIVNAIPSTTNTILLTSETSAQGIINHHNKVQTSSIQIVDKIAIDQYKLLREKLGGIKLIQVVHVLNEDSILEAIDVSRYVDFILLDSGNPHLNVKQLGGTGQTHNWAISREIVKRINNPVYLAGGLNNENVRTAIDEVQAFGVDVCTGVRTNGKLDEQKLNLFFNAIWNN